MYPLIKKILFQFPPEKAHHMAMAAMKAPILTAPLKPLYQLEDKRLERKLLGLTFKNPIGLAAGLDKNAVAYQSLANLGFGFVEIGTVTPRPQPGNDKPRLFRLPQDQALINRMGFNNDGAEVISQRLKNRNKDLLIGGNIGKNKITPNEQAIDDYTICYNTLYPDVDYFVVNVSSPNTPNLRDLQDKEPLTALLQHLQNINNDQIAPKPILLKIAPDLSDDQVREVVEIVNNTNTAGIIASNTTISRDKLKTANEKVKQIGLGGLSGKPVRDRSTAVVRLINDITKGELPLIGVGGIHSAEDALEKLDAGAHLIQLYTGFIYEGPALIKEIKQALLKRT